MSADNWYERLKRGEGKDVITQRWLDEQPARKAWQALIGDVRVYCHGCDFDKAELWRNDSRQIECADGAWRYHCAAHALECAQR